MKTLGIVRRIDDLGRVVIPKEIRQNAGIREGDALEIVLVQLNGKWCPMFAPYDPNTPGIDFGQIDTDSEQAQPISGEPYKTITVTFDQDGSTVIYKLDKNSYDLFVDLYNRGFLHYDLNWDEGNAVEEVSFC